jgi:hypothetical protein
MIAGALLLLGGLMMFSTGLLGEVLMRTYFESQGRRIYAVREVRCRASRWRRHRSAFPSCPSRWRELDHRRSILRRQ